MVDVIIVIFTDRAWKMELEGSIGPNLQASSTSSNQVTQTLSSRPHHYHACGNGTVISTDNTVTILSTSPLTTSPVTRTIQTVETNVFIIATFDNHYSNCETIATTIYYFLRGNVQINVDASTLESTQVISLCIPSQGPLPLWEYVHRSHSRIKEHWTTDAFTEPATTTLVPSTMTPAVNIWASNHYAYQLVHKLSFQSTGFRTRSLTISSMCTKVSGEWHYFMITHVFIYLFHFIKSVACSCKTRIHRLQFFIVEMIHPTRSAYIGVTVTVTVTCVGPCKSQ